MAPKVNANRHRRRSRHHRANHSRETRHGRGATFVPLSCADEPRRHGLRDHTVHDRSLDAEPLVAAIRSTAAHHPNHAPFFQRRRGWKLRGGEDRAVHRARAAARASAATAEQPRRAEVDVAANGAETGTYDFTLTRNGAALDSVTGVSATSYITTAALTCGDYEFTITAHSLGRPTRHLSSLRRPKQRMRQGLWTALRRLGGYGAALSIDTCHPKSTPSDNSELEASCLAADSTSRADRAQRIEDEEWPPGVEGELRGRGDAQ